MHWKILILAEAWFWEEPQSDIDTFTYVSKSEENEKSQNFSEKSLKKRKRVPIIYFSSPLFQKFLDA